MGNVCFENFADRSALVGAEIARLEARELDAERLYERAIGLAREQGFVQNEGLAYELASRFYAARGFEIIAQTYVRAARQCYVRWGALGKVKQLDQLYPRLQEEESATRSDKHDNGARRPTRSRDCPQSFGSCVWRDGFGESDRVADARRDRTCGR